MTRDNTFFWATVSATSPLRLRLPGDDAATEVTPDSLVGGLVVGDRVWCQLQGRALIVLGKAVPA